MENNVCNPDKEVAYRIAKIALSLPFDPYKEHAATAENLKKAVENWVPRALASPDGMAVGFIRFYVETDDGRKSGIIEISTTHKELFITVPA